MTEWSVKKEIIPHGNWISCKPVEGALISFGGIPATLALFSKALIFWFVLGQAKMNKEVEYGKLIIPKHGKPELPGLRSEDGPSKRDKKLCRQHPSNSIRN